MANWTQDRAGNRDLAHRYSQVNHQILTGQDLFSINKFYNVTLSETWISLISCHLKSEFQNKGYNLYNSDSYNHREGRVTINIKDSIKCMVKLDIKSRTYTETLWININDSKENQILRIIYIPLSR